MSADGLAPRRMMMWVAVTAGVAPGAMVEVAFAPQTPARLQHVEVLAARWRRAPAWAVVSLALGERRLAPGDGAVDRLDAVAAGLSLRPGETLRLVLLNTTRRRLRARVGLTFVAPEEPRRG